jgi:hypothetical protein
MPKKKKNKTKKKTKLKTMVEVSKLNLNAIPYTCIWQGLSRKTNEPC